MVKAAVVQGYGFRLVPCEARWRSLFFVFFRLEFEHLRVEKWITLQVTFWEGDSMIQDPPVFRVSLVIWGVTRVMFQG